MEVGPAPCVDGMNVPLDKVTMPTIKHCTTSYLELRLGSQMRYENGFFPFECVITLQNRQKCFINQSKCHKKCTGFKKNHDLSLRASRWKTQQTRRPTFNGSKNQPLFTSWIKFIFSFNPICFTSAYRPSPVQRQATRRIYFMWTLPTFLQSFPCKFVNK